MLKINQVKEKSVILKGVVLTRQPVPGSDTERYDLRYAIQHDAGYYNSDGIAICFIDDGVMYVAPNTRGNLHIISSAYERNMAIEVPLSMGEYPIEQKLKWERLRREALIEHEKEFEDDCRRHCINHHIFPIPSLDEALMRKSFRIPKKGIKVMKWYGEPTKIFPLLGERRFDEKAMELVGKYSTSDELLAFVYLDGHTYIAKKDEDLEKGLQASGFKKADFDVPLSHREVIIDGRLRQILSR